MWQALKRTNRLVGGRDVTAARVLIERFGDDAGRETIEDAMQPWGRSRGEQLRVEHEPASIAPSLETLLSRHDLPLARVWDAEAQVHDAALLAEIRVAPHDEAWRDRDAEDLGELWCDATALMRDAHLPGAQAEWLRSKCRQDTVNGLRLHARPDRAASGRRCTTSTAPGTPWCRRRASDDSTGS